MSKTGILWHVARQRKKPKRESEIQKRRTLLRNLNPEKFDYEKWKEDRKNKKKLNYTLHPEAVKPFNLDMWAEELQKRLEVRNGQTDNISK